MAEFFDFQKISKEIPFKALLNYLNIPYIEKKEELRGEDKFVFIVNTKKNLFFCPHDGSIRGSVINFLAKHRDIDLREAAKTLKTEFQANPREPKRPIPELELHYCKFLEEYGISEETARAYEVGIVKQHSVMAGKVAFKIHDREGNKLGYIGKNINNGKSDWYFPKGFKRDVVYNQHRINAECAIILASPLDVLYLIEQGSTNAVALMANSATDCQINQLKCYKKILLIHPEPQLISIRLNEFCFVKTIKCHSVRDLEKEELKSLF